MAENTTAQPHTFGGKSADVAQFPFVVSIYLTAEGINDYVLVCSGVIVSEVSLLTSVMFIVFCTMDEKNKCTVKVGSTSSDVNFGLEVEISHYIPHQMFQKTDFVDLAIIRVSKIPFSDTIQIVELPTQDLVDHQETIIVGWNTSNLVSTTLFVSFLNAI